mgnify:FL=1
MNNKVKIALAINAVVSGVDLYNKVKAQKLSATPKNREVLEVITVDGEAYTVYLVDHALGLDYNLAVNTLIKEVEVTRRLYKDTDVYLAVFQHELGHIHAGHGLAPNDLFKLIQCELEADAYAVSQGCLEGLLKFRISYLSKTLVQPLNYNNVCLAKLAYLKLKAKLSK